MCRDKKDSKRNPLGMALLLTVLVSAIACNGSSSPAAGTGGRANTGGAISVDIRAVWRNVVYALG